MKHQFLFLFFVIAINLCITNSTIAQERKACDIVSVEQINQLLKLNLIYDKNSIINRTGKFECRFTNPSLPGTYISISLLAAKVEYGYDLLDSDFKTNKGTIETSGKAGGKFTKFFPFQPGGKNAFYMTGEKTDFSGEAFVFKIRKGDYIITLSSENIPLLLVTDKIPEMYKLFEKL